MARARPDASVKQRQNLTPVTSCMRGRLLIWVPLLKNEEAIDR